MAKKIVILFLNQINGDRNMQKRLGILFIITFSIMMTFTAHADYLDTVKNNANNLRIIATHSDAQPVFSEAVTSLDKYLQLRLNTLPQFKLVTSNELDNLAKGLERRLHIGLYRWNGSHNVFIMSDLNRDKFFGVAVHELTHAWQMENAPRDQDLVIREGFASWVAYKILQMDGALIAASDIHDMADPVYGVGFKLMLDLEKTLGEKGVIERMKAMRRVNEK